ncbi:MAG: 16S rRNA (guanine(966)-N(2))-methyltransferase RsmD [Bacteroidia bacterium]
MRIISGFLGGRVLKVPAGLPVRPTTDKMKEALFNILANQFEWEDLKVMDLCCGTGSLSLEFMSRGAKEVIAVDKDRRCVKTVKDFAQQLELEGLQVIQSELGKWIKTFELSETEAKFDIIFADPPYHLPNQTEMIETILAKEWLSEEGWLIWEHSSLIAFDSILGFCEERKYGSSALSFFRKEAR